MHPLLVEMIASVELHELRAGDVLVAWLQARPPWCDRGRYHGIVEVPHFESEKDPWPRYYFDLDRAKAELEAYCRAKRIDLTGAVWVRKL
jgi:hypothetical protein